MASQVTPVSAQVGCCGGVEQNHNTNSEQMCLLISFSFIKAACWYISGINIIQSENTILFFSLNSLYKQKI